MIVCQLTLLGGGGGADNGVPNTEAAEHYHQAEDVLVLQHRNQLRIIASRYESVILCQLND